MSEKVSIKAIGPVSKLGEAPHWQKEYQALLYVDIDSGKIFRYFPKTDRLQQLTVEDGPTGRTVSFVLPVKGRPDLLLIGHAHELAGVRWPVDAPDDSTAKAVSFATVDGGKNSRFNDGKCDPQGRIFAGTMGMDFKAGERVEGMGSLFRFCSDLKPKTCIENVSISNGTAWSHDGKIFYYIDTVTSKIEAFDHDVSTGDISNRRTVVDYKKETIPNDRPDGMTIDASGNLWVANFASQKIICIDPVQKKIIRKLDMPAKNMTSVCFGGDDYSTLYATSATIVLTPDELASAPESGKLFEIKGLGVNGLPPAEAVVDANLVAKIEA